MFALLDELAVKGLGVIMVSSEIEELVDHCDRVVVLARGRTVDEFEGEALEERTILQTIFEVEGGGSVSAPAAVVRTTSRVSDLLSDIPMLLLRYGMVVVFLLLVVLTVALDSQFLESSNLLNLALQWAPVGIMAIGMTYVIIAGGFDLSVGGIYAGAAVLYAAVAQGNSDCARDRRNRARRCIGWRHQWPDYHAPRCQPVRGDARNRVHASRPGARRHRRHANPRG